MEDGRNNNAMDQFVGVGVYIKRMEKKLKAPGELEL
jgi:hypothetical protein